MGRIAVDEANSDVKLYYTNKNNSESVLLTQTKVTGELEPTATAILGTMNNNMAEIITTEPNRSIRWQENG